MFCHHYFALKYNIWKAQESPVGLKLNRTQQLLVYADDVNLLGDYVDTINKNTQTVIDNSKKVGLEVNIEKSIHQCLVKRMQSKIITEGQPVNPLIIRTDQIF
jgi:hypothetical protein